jgi:pimeloyl-ACP methyl ester carboxylesterase
VIERVDLGPCLGFDYQGDGPVAIALPGSMLGGMPALYYAIEPLLADRWRVVLVWWDHDDEPDPWRWVAERTHAAIDYAGHVDLLIGKSLGSLAAPFDIPTVWLTPLLTEEDVVVALEARTQPSLFVGGTADPTWDREIAERLGDAVEIEGADHGLAKISQAQQVADAVGDWVSHARAR